jgi:GTPase SAR1 family protein
LALMIADHYLQLRTELETALGALLKLTADLRRNSSTLDTVHGLIKDIREPLLFVAVGEVKAGKSSLLNALFGEEFAKVDVLPATDRVYIFRYGSEEKSVEVSPQLTERYLPIPFLRDFSVVDTPGTNTMVPEHQSITEGFIPRSDLILFVFSVVNPWSQSAWELLTFVQKKWLKNVVFVLQQADLRDASEIEIIHRHLRDTAMQKLGFAPPIFSVSARKALLARTTGLDKEKLWQESRFELLEKQINQMVTESGAGILKLRSTARTAGIVLDEVNEQIAGAFETIERDEEQLARVDRFLQARKEQTLRQVAGFLKGVEQACHQCARQGKEILEQKLSFWRTWRLVWSREQWQQEFQKELEIKLRQTIQPQIEHAVQLLETDLRGLWPQLQETIEERFKSPSSTRIHTTIPDFARERSSLVNSIQLALVERMAGRGVEEQLSKMFQETATWLRLPAGVAAAGGIVTVIVAMSSAAVADVTGVLAASAAVIGTIVAFSQRKRILSAYEKAMETKRVELAQAIEDQMNHAIALFYQEIALAFAPLAAFCTSERKRCEPLQERAGKLKETLSMVTQRLGAP